MALVVKGSLEIGRVRSWYNTEEKERSYVPVVTEVGAGLNEPFLLCFESLPVMGGLAFALTLLENPLIACHMRCPYPEPAQKGNGDLL